MSSWLDLINVGMNATQSYHIHQAQEQLQRMEAGAAAATLHAQVLEIMRNYVFEIAQDIKALEEHLQSAPQQVYVVAHALSWRLQDLGLTPEIFPEFADKEYVQRTETKIRYAIQESQTMLTPEQHTQADRAVEFVEQSDLLQQAIEAVSAQEELQATEPEWQELSRKSQGASGKKTLGRPGLLGTFIILPWLLFGIVSMMANTSEILGSLSGLVALVVWPACLAGSIVLLAQSKPTHYEQLKETRGTWQSKLLPREKWERVVNLWGERSSQGYRGVQESRNNFLRGIFGQLEGFDKFLPVSD